MTVKEITLLSKEEYKKHRSVIPVISYYWCLRSPGKYQDQTTVVDHNGDIVADRISVYNSHSAVRPALKLNLEMTDNRFWYKPEKLVGSKIRFGKYNWTVLDANLGELYVLCDKLITRRRFDPESNDWDASELKRWLKTEGMKLITI